VDNIDGALSALVVETLYNGARHRIDQIHVYERDPLAVFACSHSTDQVRVQVLVEDRPVTKHLAVRVYLVMGLDAGDRLDLFTLKLYLGYFRNMKISLS